MNHREVGRYWNANAPVWTRLARAGCDVYRDHLNTPAFLAMLPEVTGLSGLDIGCGEGHNTRLVAGRGAAMTAVDIAENFIAAAQQTESESPLGIRYRVASAVELPFRDGFFDFATAFMSMMDIGETDQALGEAWRVLKTGGFFQFSLCHPCTDTAHRRNLRDPQGRTYALELGGYYSELNGVVEEWIFGQTPSDLKSSLPKFKIPRFTRTLSHWVNLLLETGFQLEQLAEPRPTDEVVRAYPALQDAQMMPYFLHVRVRKLGDGK